MTDSLLVGLMCVLSFLAGAMVCFFSAKRAVDRAEAESEGLRGALDQASETIFQQSNEIHAFLKQAMKNDDAFIN